MFPSNVIQNGLLLPSHFVCFSSAEVNPWGHRGPWTWHLTLVFVNVPSCSPALRQTAGPLDRHHLFVCLQCDRAKLLPCAVLEIQAGNVKVRQHRALMAAWGEMFGLFEDYFNNPMVCVCVCVLDILFLHRRRSYFSCHHWMICVIVSPFSNK